MRAVQSRYIKCGAMQAILSLGPNSHLGILVPHSDPISGLRTRPNLDLGTSVLYKKNSKKEKKVIESLGVLFLQHLGRAFPLIKSLNRW